MRWLQSNMDLIDHRKTLRLTDFMGWELPYALGALHLFWFWCLRQARDGDLRPFTPEEIARGAGVPVAQAKQFLKAMIKAGFIDKTPYLRVHDWWDHAGSFLKSCYRQYPEKWQRIRALYHPESEEEDEAAPDEDTSETGLSPVVDVSKTRQEKKREEKKREEEIHKKKKRQPHHHPHQSATQSTIGGDDEGGEEFSLDQKAKASQEEEGDCPFDQPGANSPVSKQQIDKPVEADTWNGEHRGSDEPQRELTAAYRARTDASAESAIRRIIQYRVGSKYELSASDIEQLIALKDRHGPKFYEACKELHGGVKHVPRFLEKVLTPKKSLADEVEELMKNMQDQLTIVDGQ